MNVQQNPTPSLEEIERMPVHEMAARFPMWEPDRLKNLADDIAANGLNIPLVIWQSENMLLDGRNRLAACVIAGVQPRVEWWEGPDPRALIISRNIQSREMKASQKAMLLAVEFPDEGKAGRSGDKNSSAKIANIVGNFSRELLRQARLINKHNPDMVAAVISGATGFNEALKTAELNRTKGKSTEARLERLREAAPDLARQVLEDALSLEEAEGALNARLKQESNVREAGRRAVQELASIPTLVASLKGAIALGEKLSLETETVAALSDCVSFLRGLNSSGERP